MMADAKKDSGISILRPRVRFLHTLGDELIGSKTATVPIVIAEVFAQFSHILREVHT